MVVGIEAEITRRHPHRDAAVQRHFDAERTLVFAGLHIADAADPFAVRTFDRDVMQLHLRLRDQIEPLQARRVAITIRIGAMGILPRIFTHVIAAQLAVVMGAILLIVRLSF